MNILILGSGGREHAFTWKIRLSPYCDKLFVAPGNAGTADIAVNVNISPEDFISIGRFCIENEIHLLLVGPEIPLILGVTDYFKNKEELKHISVIGPDKLGAVIEGSKDFSKAFMKRHNIPTASSLTFTKKTFNEGVEYLKNHSLPIVLKADGPAAGKGVIIAQSHEEAIKTLDDMLNHDQFGESGSKVVVEQFLSGIEVSVFVITDGINYKILPEAKDYKRIGDNDSGPNTGGMGAVSPVIFADQTFMEKVEERIIKPTVDGLKKEGVNYVGFIFFGLIKVEEEPYVIEYNCRMGDPETEVVIPRIKSDFVKLLQATAGKKLDKFNLEVDERPAVTVMMVSGGYPGNYEKGKKISGLHGNKKVIPFHAGTTRNPAGEVITNGGRVISVTAFGDSIGNAISNAYDEVAKITWESAYYRKDIGQDLLSLENR
jgi:phosphoribosylamine---glycine ligase